MTLLFRSLILVILCCATFTLVAQGQTTINAASCNLSDVQAALNKVTADGTTVLIPSGTCTWSTTLTYTASNSLTILGSGSQSTPGGGDATIIVDATSPNAALAITTVVGKSFRLAAITFQGASGGTLGYNGTVRIMGTSQAARVDHVHFKQLNDLNLAFYNWVYGVVDHSVFDGTSVINGVRVEHDTWNGYINGNGAWADLPYYGTNKAIYIEDNTFNCSGDNCFATDSDSGGHIVFRHNSLTNTIFQVHDQASDHRAPRMFEMYNNSFNASDSNAQLFDSAQLRGGSGMVFNNTSNMKDIARAIVDRSENNSLLWGECAIGSTTCGNWGMCGPVSVNASNGGPSAWDQNSDSNGYPCMDQIGRGKGDLITGTFPNKVNSATNSISYPNQAVEPVYEWNDSWTNACKCGSLWLTTASSVLSQNRDYYLYTANFNGTSGVGSGPISDRPTSCAAGPGGNTPGVAYWATDTGTLYTCNPANTWTAYYTPYVYPHPLVAGGGVGTPPAPAGLIANAK